MTTRRAARLRPTRPSRLVIMATAVLTLLLMGLGTATGDDGTVGTDGTEPSGGTEELPATSPATLSWGDLGTEASLVCEPERPLPGEDLVCLLTGGQGFDAVDVTFDVFRLLDEYDEGQLSEVVQEEAQRVPIDAEGVATVTFVVRAEARTDDVYDVAAFESSTTACYAAVPLVDDQYDLEDGIFTILAGPGALTVDDDGEGFTVDGEAFRMDDAEPICNYLVAWTGGEVGGTPPPDDDPVDDGDDHDGTEAPEGVDDAPADDDATADDDAPADDDATTEADDAETTPLPATGSRAGGLAAFGALLLGGGLVLSRTGRRPARSTARPGRAGPRG
jgi:LPXTG-motif cell wall-anchored protein